MVKNNLLRLLISTLIIAPNVGFTAPQGGQVIAGQATISNPSANLTVITQTTSKAILQFDSFNINQNQTVQFVQPSSSSIALNRVTSANPTTILGNLNANGQVFIVNPRGVIFGQSARVDVAGLVATTLDISNNDFLAGQFNFSRVAGSPSADVINNGEINADNGYVVLAGDYTENAGVIQANLGTVVLASGRALTLDLQGDGMINFAIDESAVNELRGVNNQGSILADGGIVILTATVASDLVATAVRNDGLIQAHSIVEREGEIFLSGFSGDTLNSGTLDVSGDNTVDGGLIAVTGERVALLGDANLDASGKNGGTILVGGDFQGQSDTLIARDTVVREDVTLNANALVEGDGGRVIVFADDSTRFSGTISAQGGAVAGDGGFVEVSGLQFLQFDGDVALSAVNGESGTLLLDPFNIFIVDAIGEAGVDDAQLDDGVIFFADNVQDDFFITQETLEGLTGTVILQAENDIVIEDLLDGNLNFVNLAAGDSVTFQAGNNIVFNDPFDTLTTQGAAIVLEANSINSSAAGLNNGGVFLGGLNANGGDIRVTGGNISTFGGIISGGNINIGDFTTGDISVNGETTFISSGQNFRFTAELITVNNGFTVEGFDITFEGNVLGAAFNIESNPTPDAIFLDAGNDIRFIGALNLEDTPINATAVRDIVITGFEGPTQTSFASVNTPIVSSFNAGQDFIQEGDITLIDLFSENVSESSFNITTTRDTIINGDFLTGITQVNTQINRDLIITGTTQATNSLLLSAEQDINLSIVDTGGFADFDAGGNVQIDSLVTSSTTIFTGGDALLGDINAAFFIDINSVGDTVLGNITTEDVSIQSTGNVTFQNAVSANGIEGGVFVSGLADVLINAAIDSTSTNIVTQGDVLINADIDSSSIFTSSDTLTVNGDLAAEFDINLFANNILVAGSSQIRSGSDLTFTADADNDGVGNFRADAGVTLSAVNVTINAVTAELNLNQIDSANITINAELVDPNIVDVDNQVVDVDNQVVDVDNQVVAVDNQVVDVDDRAVDADMLVVDVDDPVVQDIINDAILQTITNTTTTLAPFTKPRPEDAVTDNDALVVESIQAQPMIQLIAEAGNACRP